MGNFEGKMKWHKFHAYFWLWVSALMQFASFSSLKSGSIWGDYKDDIYDTFSAMKSADQAYAVISLVVAILSIVAAIGLIKYKKFGPVCFIGIYVVNILGGLYYASALSSNNILNVVDKSSLQASLAVPSRYTMSAFWSIILIVLNLIYFGKRKDLYD